MHGYVSGEDDEEQGDAPDPEFIDLPYSKGLALDLWLAWKEHHVGALAGGYLDQPPAWRALIHAFTWRYNLAEDDWQAERAEARGESPRRRRHKPDDDPLPMNASEATPVRVWGDWE